MRIKGERVSKNKEEGVDERMRGGVRVSVRERTRARVEVREKVTITVRLRTGVRVGFRVGGLDERGVRQGLESCVKFYK